MSSTDAPSGSTTTAFSSASSWKTSGAVSTQSPDPMQSPRSTSTWIRLWGESSVTRPLRLPLPEARPQPGPSAIQADVDVVAVSERLVQAVLAATAPVVAVGVAAHALLPG